MMARIEQDVIIPEPRRGLAGQWDQLIGPGATTAEQVLILLAALLGGALVVWRAFDLDLGWSVWQWLVALVVALDVFGGVVANGTTAAKRWYHRPGQGARQHLLFAAVHIIQIAAVALLFPGLDWLSAGLAYAYLLGSAAVIVFVPRYLERPVALALTLVGFLLSLYVLPLVPGLEWFFAALFLKLLVSHLPFETPWEPAAARQ
jgi:hypothetical protein